MWAEHCRLLPVRLIDGTLSFGTLMRRKKADGTWEYRRLTPEEQLQHDRDWAW